MARNRKKMSLYEVIGGPASKLSYGKTLEQLHPGKSGKDEPVAEDSAAQLPERVIGWPKKPRIAQFNAGRIEISMPYQLAIALLLGAILLVLVVFRLGQSLSGQKPIEPTGKMPKSVQKVMPETPAIAPQRPDIAEKVSLNTKKLEQPKSKGNNRIVIQTYQTRAQLDPVKQYFAGKGVETEIRKISNMYYLVTKDKYENPGKVGTDGYFAKQKIIELGAKYKAPQGYGTFGSKPFHDAYGMKFDD